jgi:hypothetical protein
MDTTTKKAKTQVIQSLPDGCGRLRLKSVGHPVRHLLPALNLPDLEAAIRASTIEKNCPTMSISENPFVVPMPGR